MIPVLLSLQKKIRRTGRIWDHFKAEVQAEWMWLAKAFGASCAAVLLQIAQPWPLKIVFDYILFPRPQPNSISRFLDRLGGSGIGAAAAVCGAMVLITWMRSQFEFSRELNIARAGQRVVSAIRGRLYRHIQRLSQSFHDQSRSGDLLLRLTGDIVMLREMLVASFLNAAGSIMIILGMVAIMLVKDPLMTVFALLVVPVLFFISFHMGGKIKQASKHQRKKEGRVASLAHETIVGIKDVQAFGREKYESRRFEKHIRGSLRAGLKATRLEARMNRAVQMTLSTGTAVVVLFGIKRVLDSTLTPGDLLVFMAYMRGMYRPIGKLAKLTRRYAKAVACGERVVEILETEPQIKDSPSAGEAPPFKGEIEFREVTFSFGDEGSALKKVSFHVSPGETIAFVGPSGAGKSTLLNLLLRFYQPQKGEIMIDGCDVRNYTLESLRGQISPVLQDSVLFGMSIRDNIGFGKPNSSLERIIRAAQKANAHSFIQEFSLGYETVLGERGTTLSGGEKRRIVIARAILKKAPILILDEPTVGIDAIAEKEVIDALAKLASDKTVFIISHTFSTILRADRIFYFDKGKIMESGSHEELLAAEGKYYQQYRKQFPVGESG